MSDIFLMSIDVPSNPIINLKTNEVGPTDSIGWGIGWYPNNFNATSVLKDLITTADFDLTQHLSESKNFRSSSFFLKTKEHDSRYNLQNTQPFINPLRGQEWLFMHRGNLDKEQLQNIPMKLSQVFQPLGTTDSEYLFSILMSKMLNANVFNITDLEYVKVRSFLRYINTFGESDIVLSDGSYSIVYSDSNHKEPLYYTRLIPPINDEVLLDTDAYTIGMKSIHSNNRSILMVSSTIENKSGWHMMPPGHMMVVSRGSILWSSFPAYQDEVLVVPSIQFDYSAENAVNDLMTFQKTVTPPVDGTSTILNIRSITHSGNGQELTYRTYNVTHTTEYEYQDPVEFSTHILRLQPLDDQQQELVQSTLSMSINSTSACFEDVFGNQSIYVEITQPYSQLSITCETTLKVFATEADPLSLAVRRPQIPLAWMPWQRQMMQPYLLTSELPESQLLEIYEYAMSFVERNNYDLLKTVNDINKHIYTDYNYISGSTELNTTPFEVFSKRHGVCQDFANLFICMARLLGIPARYQVGYIYTGANYDNKEQGDATHAWIELYLPYIGWRGFDPTNGCLASQDHIRVAKGRHYQDATPTSGTIYSGGGKEQLKVYVKVEAL